MRATGLTLARSAVRAVDVSAANMAANGDDDRGSERARGRNRDGFSISTTTLADIPDLARRVISNELGSGRKQIRQVGNWVTRMRDIFTSSACATVYNPHPHGATLRLALPPCMIYHIVVVPEISAILRQSYGQDTRMTQETTHGRTMRLKLLSTVRILYGDNSARYPIASDSQA